MGCIPFSPPLILFGGSFYPLSSVDPIAPIDRRRAGFNLYIGSSPHPFPFLHRSSTKGNTPIIMDAPIHCTSTGNPSIYGYHTRLPYSRIPTVNDGPLSSSYHIIWSKTQARRQIKDKPRYGIYRSPSPATGENHEGEEAFSKSRLYPPGAGGYPGRTVVQIICLLKPDPGNQF